MNEIDFKKETSFELQYIVLNKVLIFTAIVGFFSGFINIINKRPLVNILSSLVIASISAIMISFVKHHKFRNYVRYFYLIGLTVVFIPYGWLTSPGSTSAFTGYCLLIMIISSLMISKKIELFIPAVGLAEIILLIQYESHNQDKFYHYTDPVYRGNDLSLNYFLIGFMIVYVLYSINKLIYERDRVLYKLSVTDQLTGLYNRRYIYDKLDELYSQSVEKKECFSIALIDIHNLKKINDDFGHIVGDNVLVKISKTLQEFYHEETTAGRFGGDNFMLVFPNKTVEQIKPMIIQLEGRFSLVSKEFHGFELNFSAGFSDSNGKNVEAMIHEANQLLSKNKMKFKE